MPATVPWYVQQRAESLAIVFLTRDPRVSVQREQGLDFGVDFRLMIDGDDANAWAGVQLHALDAAPPATVPWRRPGLSQQYFELVRVPLLLLAVNARTEDCFFAWIKEPTLESGVVRLVSHMTDEQLPLAPFDDSGYRRVVANCRAYFESNRRVGAA